MRSGEASTTGSTMRASLKIGRRNAALNRTSIRYNLLNFIERYLKMKVLAGDYCGEMERRNGADIFAYEHLYTNKKASSALE